MTRPETLVWRVSLTVTQVTRQSVLYFILGIFNIYIILLIFGISNSVQSFNDTEIALHFNDVGDI